jgi:hypothetical protein
VLFELCCGVVKKMLCDDEKRDVGLDLEPTYISFLYQKILYYCTSRTPQNRRTTNLSLIPSCSEAWQMVQWSCTPLVKIASFQE